MSNEIRELTERLEEAHRRLLESLDGIAVAELNTRPAETEWSVAEVCAHVVEMQLHWVRKADRIAELEDIRRTDEEREGRMAAITRHAGDGLDTIVRRLRDANGDALEIVRGLTPAQLAQRGKRDGSPVTARQVIEGSVIEHIYTHARQIDEARRIAGA